ncbi:hypothetical protein DHW03_05675 [Pedobacter yonginense]|uniref:Fimbrial assembly protein n=1 Tax=Pedobacter yonginense TaxID=651869 RepID=A0A317ESB7_9SPHI|nr:PilN domain-containing protein [Pedobacter yonginense]PWS29305.1 hypothetical protein DHW03_05675 [Pedobacter yonginense]
MLGNQLNTILGIEIRFLSENAYSCRSCLLKRNGNTVDIEVGKIAEGSLAQVLEKLPRNYPVALVLTGRGIIHKTLSVEQDIAEPFKMAFPTIESAEFYAQHYPHAEELTISITRKESIDALLTSLELAGLNVLALSLGGMVISHVITQFEKEEGEVAFDGHLVNISNRGIKSDTAQAIQSEFKKINLAGNRIDERSVLSYAVAFQLMMLDNVEPILADVGAVNNRRASFAATNAIKKRAMYFLATLFISLLISFLLFTHFNSINAELALKVGRITSSGNQTELLKKNTAENQLVLKALGWNGGYSYSFLADEIGRSMPKQLALTELSFNGNPTKLEKQSKSTLIDILGSSDNLMAVNNWIYILKEKKWVKKVSLLKYEEDQERETFRFTLRIEY